MNTTNYATFDMGLAAALVTAGFELYTLDKTDPRKVEFIFEALEDDNNILNAVKEYWDSKLLVSGLAYFNNLKMLKSRIYN